MSYQNKHSKSEAITERDETPVLGEYDVIVLGGGIAGVSAALAAKRNGASTLIVEKSIMLGGLATIGFVNKYLPLCDGNGIKVCGGICEELLYLSIKYGYNTLSEEWAGGKLKKGTNKRYMSVFSPYDFVLALDEKIQEEGIDILFDTIFCKPSMQGGKCEAIIVENKSGRAAYKAKYFVDATGDADLMYRAGVDCGIQKNWLTYWGYVTSVEKMEKGTGKSSVMQGVPLWELGSMADGTGGSVNDKYDGTDAKEITSFVLNGRKIMREKIKTADDTEITTVALPHMPQVRTTRHIIGATNITEKDLNQYIGESIGCAPDWRRNKEVYEVPFGALYNPAAENIITAGRCIAAGDDSWEVTRAIPACSVTGEAAGTACAIALKEEVAFEGIEIKKLQEMLTEQGAILHYKNK